MAFACEAGDHWVESAMERVMGPNLPNLVSDNVKKARHIALLFAQSRYKPVSRTRSVARPRKAVPSGLRNGMSAGP